VQEKSLVPEPPLPPDSGYERYSQNEIPRFRILAGVGGVLVYVLASLPLVLLITIYVAATNASTTSEEATEALEKIIENSWFLVAVLLTQCIGFLIYAFIVSKTRGSGDFRNDFGLKFTKSALWFIPAGFGLQIIGIMLSTPLALLKDEASEQEVVSSFKDSSGFPIFVLAILFALIVPVIEEICFRGLFQRGLMKRFSPLIATLLSGSIFAAIHFADPNALLGGTSLLIVGLFAAALATYRGRIDASICLHVGFNLTTVVFLLISL